MIDFTATKKVKYFHENFTKFLCPNVAWEVSMTVKEKINLLEELLLINEGTLDQNTQLSNISEWDSMAIISTIAMFDSVFNKDIKSTEIKKFKTVKDIIDKME